MDLESPKIQRPQKSPPELIDYWFLIVFKKHVREFSCGYQYYRTFHIDPKRDVLYVGAMDRLYRLNLNNVNKSRCDRFKLDSTNLKSGAEFIDRDRRNRFPAVESIDTVIFGRPKASEETWTAHRSRRGHEANRPGQVPMERVPMDFTFALHANVRGCQVLATNDSISIKRRFAL
ncbi:hypothetical protein NPIL_374591 [Nephila pilipes]|uniref:Uncharacterized protein n=1 Tax=Nephila pilipes TaxID=299642 RepID=A0A8X6T9Z6_NEPPI|nr:hypothetical protein NPIL_374591 [Nephila pilipes]